MALDQSTKMQIGAGLAGIAVFVALVVYVGIQWGEVVQEEPSRVIDLDPTGGLMMVGVLIVFVVFMSVLGLALSDKLSED